jgi:type IV pilus assembly protein PilA
MFKLLKSKKGFTLVELMIVVVIMAILVAVAVPIFSAVTKNARTKTCIGNQREIISSVGNWLMLQSDSTIAGSFVTEGGQDAPKFGAFTGLDAYQAEIKGLFKTTPVCPDAANKITVTITAAADANAKATVSTACTDTTDHVIPNGNTNG